MTNTYAWGMDKNETLRRERGFSFEDVVSAIEQNGVLGDVGHPSPNYPHQRIFFVALDNYAVAVPYIRDGDSKFLKTAFYSRRATKLYLNR